jgi:glycosyltransferase involved in cell wall biosynthesis
LELRELETDSPSLVSIGLPVYNGELFLAAALDSFLAQTYRHFELIISDNASTDGTEEICRRYAKGDPRIRYFRCDANVGPRRNFNRVFELAQGKYFKWAAHDDEYAPDFLSKCVAALERDASVVLSYPRVLLIDEHSKPLTKRRYPVDTTLTRPQDRFAQTLWVDLGSPAIFGVVRRDVLAKTPLMGFTHAADQVLLGELALRGRFFEIPEELLFHREHDHRSVRDNPTRQKLAIWWAYGRGTDRIVLPMWRRLYEQTGSVWRTPLRIGERLGSWFQLCRWIRYNWRAMAEDVKLAVKHRSASLENTAKTSAE